MTTDRYARRDPDAITVIDFSAKREQVENLDALPPEAIAKFNEAKTMRVRGFQEILGYDDDRRIIWSCGGYWTSREPDAKFHITSMGDGTQLFVE